MVVLDSWALLAYLKDEPPAERIEGEWLARGAAISSINLGEVLHIRIRASGENSGASRHRDDPRAPHGRRPGLVPDRRRRADQGPWRRTRIERFVTERIVPLETDRARYDEYDNLRIDELDALRAEVKAAGLWAPQMPRADGGLGLSMQALVPCYEAMNASIFGPVVFNSAAPDDGNMMRAGEGRHRRRKRHAGSRRSSTAACARRS